MVIVSIRMSYMLDKLLWACYDLYICKLFARREISSLYCLIIHALAPHGTSTLEHVMPQKKKWIGCFIILQRMI